MGMKGLTMKNLCTLKVGQLKAVRDNLMYLVRDPKDGIGALNGIHVVGRDDKVAFTATDGKYMGQLSFMAKVDNAFNLVVDSAFFKPFSTRSQSGQEKELNLYTDGSQLTADNSRAYLLEGNYPDVDKCYPKMVHESFSLRVGDLKVLLKAVTTRKMSIIDFNIKANKHRNYLKVEHDYDAAISVKASAIVDNHTLHYGTPDTYTYDANRLHALVGKLPEDKFVSFEFESPLSACKITLEDISLKWEGLCMPCYNRN
jgi:hypothetical protein